MLIMLKSN